MAKSKASGVNLPNCNLTLHLFGKRLDTNGNAVVRLSFPNQQSFSIQTNGVLPQTQYILDRIDSHIINESVFAKISTEVCSYIEKHGSKKQKETLKRY